MAVALVIKLSGRVFENEELVLKYVEVLKTVKEKICVITGEAMWRGGIYK